MNCLNCKLLNKEERFGCCLYAIKTKIMPPGLIVLNKFLSLSSLTK